MLNIDQIVKEYPRELRVYKTFLYKEYLQYKILAAVFKSKASRKLSFLGGTALRIVHNNQRFSEDLDFDNFGLKKEEFNLLISEVKKGLEREGFILEEKKVHKGAFRCYIRFPELLYKTGLSGIKDQKILIQIDTMPHDFKYKPETVLLNKFDVFREIKVTPPDIILGQKIYSLFNRKRDKGRDYYDTAFLLAKTRPNYRYLKKKMGIDKPDKLRKKLLDKCKTANFTELLKDVKPFIFEKDGYERVNKFKKLVETAKL